MDALSLLPEVPTREQIERLEREMMALEAQMPEAIVDLPAWHHFADGLAARTILIRAGTVLTGGVHTSEHLNIAAGDITVWTEDGMKRLTGYHVLPSKGGAKRVGLAWADTYWTTVHTNADNCRDVQVLEDRLITDAHNLQSRRLPVLCHEQRERIA